MKLYWYLLESV